METKMRKKNTKAQNILAAILLLFFVVYMLVSGIMDLTNKKDLYTLNIDGATTILEVENTVAGIIPIGTDHYYIGVEKGTTNAYIIKGPKNWLSKNFTEQNESIDPNGVTITALAKREMEYKVEDEIYARASTIEGLNYPIGTVMVLNLSYKLNAIMRLACLVFGAAFALMVFYNVKSKKELSAPMKLLALALFMGLLVTILIVLR